MEFANEFLNCAWANDATDSDWHNRMFKAFLLGHAYSPENLEKMVAYIQSNTIRSPKKAITDKMKEFMGTHSFVAWKSSIQVDKFPACVLELEAKYSSLLQGCEEFLKIVKAAGVTIHPVMNDAPTPITEDEQMLTDAHVEPIPQGKTGEETEVDPSAGAHPATPALVTSNRGGTLEVTTVLNAMRGSIHKKEVLITTVSRKLANLMYEVELLEQALNVPDVEGGYDDLVRNAAHMAWNRIQSTDPAYTEGFEEFFGSHLTLSTE